MTLWPRVDLGDDLAVALFRAGIKSCDFADSQATGFAMVANGRAVRLKARTMAEARVEAAHGATICRAVANGRWVLFERIEKIETLQAGTADADAALVAPNGMLVEKRVNVRIASDFQIIMDRLAGQLRYLDREFLRPHLKKFLGRLDVNWPALTTTQINETFSKARGFLAGISTEKLMPMWTAKVSVTIQRVGRSTRAAIREAHLPRIGTVLSSPEVEAIDRIAIQQGWFLRNKQGRISNALTARGRKIVESGLADGLGRNEIGRMLTKELPGLANQYGKNYASTVASNAVSRARSYSEIAAYQSAGIEYLEIAAQLDERTTICCRFMDGQIINVKKVGALLDRAASVTDPADIYRTTPFIGTKRGKDGKTYLQTRTGAKLAEVTRSGMGRADDRGQFKAFVGGSKFTSKGIGAPPFHHRCRSLTFPRTEMFQVPRGYEPRAVQQRSPTEAVSRRGKPTGRLQPMETPLEFSPVASRKNPVSIGTVAPPDFDIPVPPRKMKSNAFAELGGRLRVGETVRNQLIDRVDKMRDTLSRLVVAQQDRAGRALINIELGKLLVYAAEYLSMGNVGRSVKVSQGKPGIKGATKADQVKAYNLALPFVGPDLWAVLKDRTLPAVYVHKTRRACYLPEENVFLVRSLNPSTTMLPFVMFQYLHDVGQIGRAAELQRNMDAFLGRLLSVGPDAFALQGPWPDRRDGLVVGNFSEMHSSRHVFDKDEIDWMFTTHGRPVAYNEFLTMAALRFRKGREVDLATMWTICPRQLALYLCVMQGNFL